MTLTDNIKSPVARRLRSTTVCLALAFLGLLPYSCTREAQPSSGRYNVSVMLDTRSINTGEVGSIAIYAFSDVNDAEGSGNLVGYLYESAPDASGVFPMTLTDCGAVDFYVILNPDSNCFDFTYADGTTVSIGDTPPSGITPGVIRGWRIKYASLDMNTPSSKWMLPMSNLDGTARGNRRFEIEDKPGLQEVPVSVTRAVSKVEVWFRSEDNRGLDSYSSGYWTITRLGSSDPVASSGLFVESASHVPPQGKEFGISDGRSHNYMNCNFPENADESSFYQEDNFTKIFEYYTLPNTVGGNTAGETPDGTGCTTLEVSYNWKAERHNLGEETKSKTVYLPAYPRNSCIRVWCALPGEEDRTFTYTVIDWDETVTVNIPDFS